MDPVLFSVLTTDPRPGSASLPDTVQFTVFFAKAVDRGTVDGDSISLVRTSTGAVVDGDLEISADGRRVTWSTSERLALRAVYRLTVTTDILDEEGTPLLKEFVASYTIGSIPAPALLRQSDFRTLQSHMLTGRSDHTATLVSLAGGKRFVVVIGGFTLGRSAPTASAEIVDVDDLSPHNDDGNIFSSSGTMPTARAYHTATAYRPGSGLILVAGGGGGSDGTTELADCRIWVISVNGFRDTGHLNIARRLHTATLIEGSGTSLDGSVLVTGGLPIDTAGDTAEIFNPDTEEWTLLSAHLHSPRQGHQATLLTQGALKGKVLITGGGTDIAEVFDPKTESFVELSDLTESFRWMFGAVELNTGQVLLTDGGDQHGELWDPGTLRFTTVSSANRLERYAPSVFRFQFPAGRGPVTGGPVDNVMIVGGATYMGGTSPWLAHADVEQFVLGTAGSGQYYSSDPAEGGINLGDPRAFSAGCDLGDNRYLITGGIPSTAIGAPPSNRDLDSVLLFDPQP